MSWGGIKRTSADVWFSKAIRLAADNTCERCGKPADDCSHYFGRRNASSRYLAGAARNGFSLCRGCHNRLGEHPHEHYIFVRSVIGEGGYDLLVEKAREIQKITKEHRREIAAHYRAECERIQDLRNQGVTGYIEVVSWQ